MRKYLDTNLDKHVILLSILIILGLILKICIYYAAWLPVGVILLFLIRLGAFFDGIIIRSYDAWDDPEPTEGSTPPECMTCQPIEEGEASFEILNLSNKVGEMIRIRMNIIRRDLPLFNLMALVVTML